MGTLKRYMTPIYFPHCVLISFFRLNTSILTRVFHNSGDTDPGFTAYAYT